MSRVFINDSTLTDIGDAIREKGGAEGLLLPSAMVEAILSIDSVELCEITLSSNATEVILSTDKLIEDVNYIVMVPVKATPFASTSNVFLGVVEYFPNGIDLGKVFYALGLANNWGNATKGFYSTTNLCEDSEDGIAISNINLVKGDYLFIIG